ncbi:MAG TPA: ABC transporter permease [Gemmatimonadaceae bacterium]|nr:ABC transporter permease [Gemmatimonadaceae bacterium]
MSFISDLRYTLRLLRKSPLFTLLTVVVLGGGLGISIFTFSFLYTAMVKPLPVSGGERIVRVSASTGSTTGGLDAYDLARMRRAITVLTDVGAYTGRELVAADEDGTHSRTLDAVAAEWNVFRTTRTAALLGRGFRAEDGARGAEPVIVLSHRTWTSVFGADSTIVGRRIELDGIPTLVIGVMPRGYGFPVASDAWVPLERAALDDPAPGKLALDVYGRLAAGVSAGAARAQLQVLADEARRSRITITAGTPTDPGGRDATLIAADSVPVRIDVESFPRAQMGGEGPLVFGVLNLLAALILLIACVDIVNLLLARVNDRAREMAVRVALGATRARLIAQNLWEIVLLTVAGGVLATAIAAWGLRVVNAWAHTHIPGNLAFWWVWQLDAPGIIAAGAFVTLTIAVLGAVVAARTTSTNINAVLQDTSARGGGRGQGRIARILVAAQVAAVSVLMFFGVLSAILADRVVHLDLGFDTRGLMNSHLEPPRETYATPEKRGAYYAAVREAVVASPAVDGAVVSSTLAELGDSRGADRLALDAGAAAIRNGAPHAFVLAMLGPMDLVGARVSVGRPFDDRDRAGGAPTVIVSHAFAAANWPGGSAIGRQMRLTGLGEEQWRTVVGVAKDVPLGDPLARDRSTMAVYVPLLQTDLDAASITFRGRGNAAAAIATLHRAVATIDPATAPSPVSTYDEILEKSALISRSVTRLFALCFAFALLLAVSGTYGLMARSIGQRTREIGVRRALGATDATIVRLLLGQSGRQLGAGALIALPAMLAIGIAFSRIFPVGMVASLVAGVLVSATIVGVVLAATYLPTRRALGITPRDALWRE